MLILHLRKLKQETKREDSQLLSRRSVLGLGTFTPYSILCNRPPYHDTLDLEDLQIHHFCRGEIFSGNFKTSQNRETKHT